MVTRPCQHCGDTFSYAPRLIGDREVFPQLTCTPCILRSQAAEDAEREARLQRQREAEWAAICPPLYRETDLARLPEAFRTAIRDWTCSPRGLGLVGPAGKGKTRAAFALLQRMHGSGLRCAAISATRLGHLSAAQFSDDRDQRARAISQMKSFHAAALLLIDDLGKCKMTERCEVDFFDLLEHRTSHQLPTLWTANARGDQLLALLSADRGEPILRRLAEFSHVVSLEADRPSRSVA